MITEATVRVAPVILCLRGMGGDKAQHLFPGIGGGVGVILEAAIEEAVGRAGIDDDLILDARLLHALLELMHLLDRDGLVSAAEETEQGIPFLCTDVYDRFGRACHLPAQAAVEAYDSGEAEILGA